jgi:hypothetical protein
MTIQHNIELKPGDPVQVVDPDSPFYQRVGRVHHLTREGRVFVAFSSSSVIQFRPEELRPAAQ